MIANKTRSAMFRELKVGDIFIPSKFDYKCFIVVQIKHNLIWYAHIEAPSGKRFFKSDMENEYVEIFFDEYKPKINDWQRKGDNKLHF